MFQQRRFVKGIRSMDIGFDANDRCIWVNASVLSVGSHPLLRLRDPVWRATRLLGKPQVVDRDNRVVCWTQQGRILSLVLSRGRQPALASQ